MTEPPLFLLGEAYATEDAKLNLPFVGSSGAELLRMLSEAGILELSDLDHSHLSNWYTYHRPQHIAAIWSAHPELYRTNVFNIHPPKNDLSWFCGPKDEALEGYPPMLKKAKTHHHWTGGYLRDEFWGELNRLQTEIIALDPTLIVCLGNVALWALTGSSGITKVRGTTLLSTHTALDFKLLPTIHPVSVLRQWPQRPIVIADFMKAKVQNGFPEIRRPQRSIWIEPSLDDIRTFVDTYIRGCDLLSVDIETSGTRITCIGFAPQSDLAIVIPFDDDRTASGSYWPTRRAELEVWGLVQQVLSDPAIPKLFQNGAYDIGFLWRAYDIKTYGAIHDTMLLHHALHPEMRKSLGLLGSIYSDEAAWKHMRAKHETIKRDD